MIPKSWFKLDRYGVPDPKRNGIFHNVGAALSIIGIFGMLGGVIFEVASGPIETYETYAQTFAAFEMTAALWVSLISTFIAAIGLKILGQTVKLYERQQNKETLQKYIKLRHNPRFLNWLDRRGCDGKLPVPTGGTVINADNVADRRLYEEIQKVFTAWQQHEHPACASDES